MRGEKEKEGGDSARACPTPRPRRPIPPVGRHGRSAQVSFAPLAPVLSRRPAGIPGAAPNRGPPRGPARPALARADSRRESGRDPAMSTKPELIELRELEPARRAGPGRTRLERANALRIAPGIARNPARQLVAGRGHQFQPAGPATHTWCDLCGDFILGVVRKGLQCAHCKFTCHYRCRALISLDCCGPRDLGWEPALERDTNVDEPVEWETPDLSQAETEQKIKEYNSQINSNLFMSLNKDGSYTGFIKVQLKLVRPVSVPSSKKPPSLQAAQRGPGRGTAVRRRTSFYLPKDAVKHLHVLSRTRAREVIEALLRKFLVVDDPRKFALFERAERHGQVYLRKLSDDEQPLRLRLLAGPSEKALSFVLKENDSGEVNWDAFSMPELHNFLRILQREEEEHLRQILQKYSYCRQKIQEALHACPLG
ncbi:ras association domain-containing protein 1 isoform X1 [Prionailurus bengalensis]|uniref:ras association domain-containing protein 1 isoform X1 n=1 Tax=Prionailurus bengalensis TaxID=37029 RepID=UPI001CA8FBEB|nr:ras association domain-containing protein 1 isoform X1 [Prionailurus bengalensis]